MRPHNDYFLTSKTGNNFNNYYWFKSAFSKNDIENLENLIAKDGLKSNASSTFGASKEARDSKIIWLPEIDNYQWVYDKIISFTELANNEMWNLQLVGVTEKAQYSIYGEGGHYTWHIDIGPNYIKRKISLVVQLSDPDVYEGGDL